MLRRLILILCLLALSAPAVAGRLTVEHSVFRLETGDRVIHSPDLVGATFDATLDGEPVALRIDSVTPSAERPAVLLHAFSARSPATGAWAPMCAPDAKGRQLGFPVAGRFDAAGRFVKDPKVWFPVCTSGAQGKCILWGYDPWARGPHGEDLAPYYEACLHMVRADYDGKGIAHTRNGTEIDVFDDLGVQTADTLNNPAYRFEAGWAPLGAVCVAKTRYADLLPLPTLIAGAPGLGGKCDPEEARRRGAHLFNRSK